MSSGILGNKKTNKHRTFTQEWLTAQIKKKKEKKEWLTAGDIFANLSCKTKVILELKCLSYSVCHSDQPTVCLFMWFLLRWNSLWGPKRLYGTNCCQSNGNGQWWPVSGWLLSTICPGGYSIIILWWASDRNCPPVAELSLWSLNLILTIETGVCGSRHLAN